MQIRLGRDHHVRVDTNDYSVAPVAIGRTGAMLCDNDEVIVLLQRRRIAARQPSLLSPPPDDHRPASAPAPGTRCAAACTTDAMPPTEVRTG
ncbi:Mu transposase domain-containing protein [Streptomyces chartreusis]|uniref:Mu transposase domain-containing protein n=1 Tax=Streptomyces chartreusis TaxID=1969 RepID=UPI0037FB3FF4